MEYTEKNYLFSHTYNLECDDILKIIKELIDELIIKEKLKKEDYKYNLKINIVKNRNEKKLGYSYLWVDNLKIYNVLIGLNFDGSERIIKEEIENNKEENLTEIWGDMAKEEKFIIKILEPLIIFPQIIMSNEERILFNLPDVEFDFNISPASKFIESNMKNIIFSYGVPNWLTEEKIRKYFLIYEKDKQEHNKKINNKTIKFKYPLVKIKNSTVYINFSNFYPQTASFVINMEKKVKFYNKKDKLDCLLFFKQKENKKN